MNLYKFTGRMVVCALALGAMFATQATQAADEEAAKTLARANNCLKCHNVSKDKEGPSFQKTAAKYKGKADAVTKITHHLTSGEKAKFPDGHEEEHKIIKAKDPAEVKNLVDWILAQ